jgi:nucleoredoxin
LAELLGSKLLSGSGEVVTTDALAGKPAVALYFSAHWCPPCRGFTPQLAQWYTQSLKAKGLEVVFASSDRDEASFKEFFKEMPWLAIPFEDRGRKEALSKRFKVGGIPTIIILDADGKVITKDGRAAISSDCTGEDFPWKPKSFKEVMAGATLINQAGQELTAEALEGKTLGLYFSAHWCPPCRGFTPQLAQWYTQSLKGKGLEVVFVSSDKDEGSFQSYFKEMPWLALNFSDRRRKEQLSSLFGVNGIPSLVIVGPVGMTITKNGRGAVASDPEGAEFPWHPKPVADLKDGPGNLNEVATVIAFCEDCHPGIQASVMEGMRPLAQKYLDKQTADGEEDPDIAFMIATEDGGMAARIREIIKLPKGSNQPRLMLMNIPDEGSYYDGPEGEVTAEVVTKFVADFEAKALKRQQLKRA